MVKDENGNACLINWRTSRSRGEVGGCYKMGDTDV